MPVDNIPEFLKLEIKFISNQKSLSLDLNLDKLEEYNKLRESTNESIIKVEMLEDFTKNLKIKSNDLSLVYDWNNIIIDDETTNFLISIVTVKENITNMTKFDEEILLTHYPELKEKLTNNINLDNLVLGEKESQKISDILILYQKIVKKNMVSKIGYENYLNLINDETSKYKSLFSTLLQRKVSQLRNIIETQNITLLKKNFDLDDILLYIPDKHLIEIPKDESGHEINIDRIEFSLRTLNYEELKNQLMSNQVYSEQDLFFSELDNETKTNQYLSEDTVSRQIYKYSIDMKLKDKESWNDSNKLLHFNNLRIKSNLYPELIVKDGEIEITSVSETKEYFLRLFYGIHKSIHFINTDVNVI